MKRDSSFRAGPSGRRPQNRRGFTLMELLISLLAATVLVAGMGSSIYLAAAAANTGIGPFQKRSLAGTVLKELDRELPHAVSVEKSPQSHRILEFQVPDRDEDGTAERIRYEWSGTPGDPLTRTVNAGTPRTVLENVHHFGLDYHSRTVVETFQQESPSQQWVNQSSTSFFDANFQLSHNVGIGTDFLPTLPENATSWSVTEVRIRCQRHGTTDGVIRVQLTAADVWRRPATVIDEVQILESQLPTSMNWYTFSFPNASGLVPGDRACLLFLFQSGTQTAMTLRTNNLSLGSSNTWLLTSTDGGASWSQHIERDLLVQINGTYMSPYQVSSYFSVLVSAELQAGEDAGSRMRTSIHTRNEPEVSLP